jgi:putative salt-induced outer membrane protein
MAFLVLAWMATASSAFAQPAAAPPPEPAKTWTGGAGAGLSVTSGNSDTLNVNLAFDLTRDPKTRHVVKAKGLYLRGEQDDEATVDRTALGVRDEYTLTPRAFVFGQLDYLRDTFKAIDYLVAPTGGIGYKVVDTAVTKWAVDAGGGLVWEKNPGQDLDTSAALTAGEALTHQLTATASLKHAIIALWKADDLADGLYTFSVGLATEVSPRVQLSVDLLDSFKNKPATADTEKNDVALVTALTMKF